MHIHFSCDKFLDTIERNMNNYLFNIEGSSLFLNANFNILNINLIFMINAKKKTNPKTNQKQ